VTVEVLGVLLPFGLAGLTFGFILLLSRSKTRIQELKLKKEIMELELRKTEAQMAALDAENARHDRLLAARIEDAARSGGGN